MTFSTGIFRGAAAGFVVVAALLVSACTPVVRTRTLPPSIRAVYIPMIENRTSEPGLEEQLTIAIQEEVLADGRLQLTREKDADAVVPITIRQFDTINTILDADGFGTNKTWEVEADFDILENIPGRPRIGEKREVTVTYGFNDDTRTINYNSEPFEKEQMARMFARMFVLELLTGEFDESVPTLVELQPTKQELERRPSTMDLP